MTSKPLRSFPYTAGMLTALVGFLVLIGWQFDVAVLKSFLPNGIVMKANTAAAFLLAGLALIALQRSGTAINILIRVCGTLIALVGLLSLAQHFIGWNIGLSEILYREPVGARATSQPGLMAPNTALNFLLLGFAFILLTLQKYRTGFLVEFMLVFPFIVSVLGLVGYVTGLTELLGPSMYTQMAVNTAATFIILTLGMTRTVYERQGMPVSIEQKLFAGLTTATAIIIFIAFLSVSGITSLVQAGDWVDQTQEVKRLLGTVLAKTLDVESGSRGFVLSGEESYAELLKPAKRDIPIILEELRRQTSDNPRQQVALTQLERLINERIEVSEQLHQTRRSRGIEEATILFRTGKGKAITDSIRVVVAQMIAEENKLLQSRNENELHQADRNRLIIYLGLAVQALLLAFIFVIVKKDVMGRKKAEERWQRLNEELEDRVKERTALLRTSEERFRSLYENSIMGIYRTTPDGKIILANPALVTMLGYSSFGELVERDLEKEGFEPSYERKYFIEQIEKYGEVKDIESAWKKKDKTVIYIHESARAIRDFDGRTLYYDGTVEDITERRRAQEALERNEALLQQTGRMAKIGSWELDLPTNTLSWTAETYRIHEVDPSTKPDLGQAINFYAPEARPIITEAVNRAIETGTPWDLELPFITATGKHLWVRAQGQSEFRDGKCVRLFGAFQDITERKRAEEELRKHREHLEELVKSRTAQLEAANKELEAFSYSVSHDLRAPLRSIDGFSQALLKDYNEQLDEQGKDFLRRVRAASQRMAALIDDILKLSRITSAEIRRERVDLSTIAREVAIGLRKTEPGRNVDFMIADGLVDHGDPQLLRVGIENLLGNAWKYTGKNPAARIEFGVTNHENKKVYYVRDNGAGFDMAYADKLFGAFQRLHSTSEFEGTGIGLATVQRIIHRHGGRVWAEGKVNEGATFYFTL